MTKEKVTDPLWWINEQLQQHGDVLKALLGKMLQLVMEQDVTALCGAGYGEQSPERKNQRNGYRKRPLDTRMGTINLEVPKLRKGSYFPNFLDARKRAERALVSVVMEAYVQGISTRRVDDLVKAMGMEGISKSEVSRMITELDSDIEPFCTRKFTQTYPYVFLDATYLKVRDHHRVVSKAVLVAYGVNAQGDREILGASIAAGEMELCWRKFLEGLQARGLRGVLLVISDHHSGLRKAIRTVLTGVSWQRCTVHFLRNVLTHVPKAKQGMIAALLRNVFQQPNRSAADEAMEKAIAILVEQAPAAAELVREAEEDVLAFFNFPERHRRQLRSTNPLERLNREIKRRTDVVGIFPNDAAVLRLLCMILIEQNEEWSISRKYFSLDSMASLANQGLIIQVEPLPERSAA